MKKAVLRSYARLIAKVGANVQKGQDVFISASLHQPEFVTMLVEECYKCKARSVTVDWDHQPLTKLAYRYETVKTLGSVPEYEVARWKYYVEKCPAKIYLMSDAPGGLKGINQEKMSKARRMSYPVLKPYKDALDNKYQWCIAAVPSREWAKKLFPELRVSQAEEKLWEAILSAARVDEDPVAAWKAHNEDLKKRCGYLNSLDIEKLHYTAGNGTDFTVGMIPGGRFEGGSSRTLSGVEYNPNMPSEECFTSPLKSDAEGIVYSSKPLCNNGQLIDNFWIRFHEGKAVEWHAEQNESLLTEIINMDEGSARLGEVALVPYSSPICRGGILFYNTLFDENAACHLALGRGFNECLEGYENMSNEECQAAGVNDSMVHDDFMIGTADLKIDAICRDGRVVPVFVDGNWAF